MVIPTLREVDDLVCTFTTVVQQPADGLVRNPRVTTGCSATQRVANFTREKERQGLIRCHAIISTSERYWANDYEGRMARPRLRIGDRTETV